MIENEGLFREYLLDAADHMEAIESIVLNIDSALTEEEINGLFRCFHTLKGNAAIIGFHDVREISHEVENMISQVRNGTLRVTKEMDNLILESVDFMKRIHANLENPGAQKVDPSEIINKIRCYTQESEVNTLKLSPPIQTRFPVDGKVSMVVKTIENLAILEMPRAFEGNLSNDLILLTGSLRGKGINRFVFDFKSTAGISRENAIGIFDAKKEIEKGGGLVAVCRMSAGAQGVISAIFGKDAVKAFHTLKEALRELRVIH